MRPKNKTIVCKRCGKKLGVVSLQLSLRLKLIAIGFLIALVTQFITQIPAELFALWLLH